jgi:hypothetical protein
MNARRLGQGIAVAGAAACTCGWLWGLRFGRRAA